MRSHYQTIPVRDSNGDQLLLYHFHQPSLLGLLGRKPPRLKLCTGEPVESREDGSFVVSSTGERLTKV